MYQVPIDFDQVSISAERSQFVSGRSGFQAGQSRFQSRSVSIFRRQGGLHFHEFHPLKSCFAGGGSKVKKEAMENDQPDSLNRCVQGVSFYQDCAVKMQNELCMHKYI